MADFNLPQNIPFSNDPAKVKQLTRSVLWKLDIHVLPPLALVRSVNVNIILTQC